jgi:hypothetical protein
MEAHRVETSRISNLDNRHIDDGEVVRLTRRQRFTTRKYSWYSFLLESESTIGSQWEWQYELSAPSKALPILAIALPCSSVR